MGPWRLRGVSGSPWHSGWAGRAGGAQLREAKVQAPGGPVRCPLRRAAEWGCRRQGVAGNGRWEGPRRQKAEASGTEVYGRLSEPACRGQGGSHKGTEDKPEARRASVTPRKEDEAREPATLAGVTEGTGQLQAAASPGTRTRHATPSSEAPFHGPHGDSCAKVSAPTRWEQVWGKEGRCAAHPRDTPQGGTWRPLQQARLLSSQCVCGRSPGPHTAGQRRSD